MPPKKNLMEHYDDGTLDLSMSGIQDIPVRDIAAIPKAINLDLSCNKIVSLPKTFAPTLARLVKLELSKNEITSLPDNFGLLVNLKHLELDSNQLVSLPLSFGNLRSLRWLDLKFNPLMPKLAEIAGGCLDAKQCQAAARNVVAALRAMQEQVDAEITRRKELKAKRAEKMEEDAKNQSKDNQPSKKKKKKGANAAGNNATAVQANGNTHLTNEEKNILKDLNNQSSPSVPTKKVAQKPGIFRRVGRLMSSLVKFVVMTTLAVVFCGFLLSLIDEDLYLSLRKRATDAVQANVPRHYLKHWDNGLLVTKRAVTKWSSQLFALATHWFGRAQQQYAAISSDETVQQYLESIKSGWHILWIWLNESYAQLPHYFTSAKRALFESTNTP